MHKTAWLFGHVRDKQTGHPRARHKLVIALFLFFSLAAPVADAAVFNARTQTLANGLQVVVVENHRAPVVAHMLWIKAGAADDPPGKSGLAHYLEHLMFKGTKKYPEGEYSRRIARIGGTENAFTSYDMTAYHAMVARQHLPRVMELESDRLAHLAIMPEAAERERKVVLDERRQRMDTNPYAPFALRMAATLFPRHPYGTPVIGWQKEVESFTAEDARAFYRRWYRPANAVLVVSGDVKAEEVFALAGKYYGPLEGGGKITRARLADPDLPGDIHITMKVEGARERLLRFKVRAPSSRLDGKRALALQVLQEVLDGSDAARLPRAMVEEKRLASRVNCGYDPDDYDATAFSITLVPGEGKTDDAVKEGLRGTLQAAETGITVAEVEKAKSSLQRAAIFARDSVMGPAYTIGRALAGGQKLDAVENWPEHIAAVTRDDVIAALKSINAAPAVWGSVVPGTAAGGVTAPLPAPVKEIR